MPGQDERRSLVPASASALAALYPPHSMILKYPMQKLPWEQDPGCRGLPFQHLFSPHYTYQLMSLNEVPGLWSVFGKSNTFA